MPHPAKDIANWFIARARSDGEYLTPMKLQKLVYIAHGWSLGLECGPLIVEPVEAWQYGPVIRELYQEFRDYGANPITKEAPMPTSIDQRDDSILEWVWSRYRTLTAIQLSALTHRNDTPWNQSYVQGARAMISTDVIRDHYRQKAEAARADAAQH